MAIGLLLAEELVDVPPMLAFDGALTVEPACALRGLVLHEVVAIRLPAPDQTGASDLEALGGAAVRLHLGHGNAGLRRCGSGTQPVAASGGASVSGCVSGCVSGWVSAWGATGFWRRGCGLRIGFKTIVMLRPSWRGCDSMMANSFT